MKEGTEDKNKPKRRKRGGRHRDRKKTGPKGPPQAPILKVTLRNIHNAEQLGTAQSMGESIIRVLIDRANERLSGADTAKLYLEGSSLQRVVQADEEARAAREEWEKRQTQAKGATSAELKEGEAETDAEEKGEENEKKEVDTKLVEGMEKLQIDSETEAPRGAIIAQVLYMVPPKKTRRRGEKPGCAYLVLAAPPIEDRSLQQQPVIPTSSLEEAAQVAAEAPPAVDYSRDVAQRRLLLQRALDSLTKCAEEDARSRQDFAGCVVEESLSTKTWRVSVGRRDRLEGTLEDSADYKDFFEMSAKDKEERLSRPKPAPGGGVATIGMTAGDDSGQPVAAIVAHLIKKKEEEKKRKQSEKKKAAQKAKRSVAKESIGKKEVNGTKKKRQRSKRKSSAAKKSEEPGTTAG